MIRAAARPHDERASHVDIEYVAELRNRRVKHVYVDADAGRIYDPVKAAERCSNALDGGFHGLLVGNIEYISPHFVAVHVAQLRDRCLITIERRDAPS